LQFALETLKRLSTSARKVHLYFYRTLKGIEIDLLLESGGVLEAYEIKWTQRPDKAMAASLQNFSQERRVNKMGILSPIASLLPLTAHISAQPWHNFLN
jgi:predicted AAA+ superfamily ATPase